MWYLAMLLILIVGCVFVTFVYLFIVEMVQREKDYFDHSGHD